MDLPDDLKAAATRLVDIDEDDVGMKPGNYSIYIQIARLVDINLNVR
jgi:hypothetical protein